jgi:hypothetical protein
MNWNQLVEELRAKKKLLLQLNPGMEFIPLYKALNATAKEHGYWLSYSDMDKFD